MEIFLICDASHGFRPCVSVSTRIQHPFAPVPSVSTRFVQCQRASSPCQLIHARQHRTRGAIHSHPATDPPAPTTKTSAIIPEHTRIIFLPSEELSVSTQKSGVRMRPTRLSSHQKHARATPSLAASANKTVCGCVFSPRRRDDTEKNAKTIREDPCNRSFAAYHRPAVAAWLPVQSAKADPSAIMFTSF